MGPVVHMRTQTGAATEFNLLGSWEMREWLRLPIYTYQMDKAELSEEFAFHNTQVEWVEAKGRKKLDNPGNPQATSPPCSALTLPAGFDHSFNAAGVLLSLRRTIKQNKVLLLWREESHLRQQTEASSRDVICHLPHSSLHYCFIAYGPDKDWLEA